MVSESSSHCDQSSYQVRFDWGVSGLRRIAPSDVVVLVDILSWSTELVADVTAAGTADLPDILSAAGEARVLVGALTNAAAVAATVLSVQTQRAERTSVAVIALGEPDPAGTRFAVEDLLGAGAIIDALMLIGIDHSSPEAAAACEAFRSLRPALRHLITASGSGRELSARGGDARPAAELNTSGVVPALEAGERFVAFTKE